MDKKLRKGDILLMQPAIILIVILFVFPLVYACKLIFTTPVYSENNQSIYTDGTYDMNTTPKPTAISSPKTGNRPAKF